MQRRRMGTKLVLVAGILLPMVGSVSAATAAPGKSNGKGNAKDVAISDAGERVTLSASEGAAMSAPSAGTGAASPRGAGPQDPATATPAGGGSADAESVISPDRRVQVTSTTAYPARATVHIVFQKVAGGGTFGCTGFMVGPDTIATAGHCVHNGNSTGFFLRSSFKLYPGRNGSTIPYTCPGGATVGAQRLWTNAGWAAGHGEEKDYGAIHTTCAIGNTTGWYGYLNTQGLNEVGQQSNTQGYPGDKPFGTQWQSRNCSTSTLSTSFVQCTIGTQTTRQVFYRNDTFGGQSGSPVYRNHNSTCCWATAIHAYGLHGSFPHNSYNHGTRIENNVTSFLNFVRNGGVVGTS